MKIERLNRDSVLLSIDSSLYSSDVVHKCFYWYGGNFDVDIETKEGNFEVSLKRKEGELSEDYFEHLQSKLRRDLIDFKTRDIVTRETADIRALLVAKAFSHSDWEDAPLGEISDPVGFKP